MAARLTLAIEAKVIILAKKYARNKGRSLSSIVEDYLKSITTKNTNKSTLSPKIAKLKGVIKLPSNFNYKKELGNILSKK